LRAFDDDRAGHAGMVGRRVHTITIHDPALDGNHVRFSWHVEPESRLYARTSFSLTFPDDVDVTTVPARVWWVVAMLCLHSHWVLLRPCVVRLPIALEAGELEFWGRLMDSEIATLESIRGTQFFERSVRIETGDRVLPPWERLVERGLCAASFSGGKDSLLQAALLRELGFPLTLVATTSPMPPFEDHRTQYRAFVLSEAPRRLGASLTEVASDVRTCWELGFAGRLGYPLAVSEMTDTFVYFSALLAVAVATGRTHLFLASEAEVQETVEVEGRVVQISHFMYSTITQQAIGGLLRPLGITYSSLTSPLHNSHVQRLLWERYPDVRSLQYSCWRVTDGQSACSACSQCLRVAIGALAAGGDPSDMGIDLAQVLRETKDWKPKSLSARALPDDVVAVDLSHQMVGNIRALNIADVRARLVGERQSRASVRRLRRGLADFADLRRRIAAYPSTRRFGYREGFFALLDPLVRDGVLRIIQEHFEPEPLEQHAALLQRNRALADRIIEPLALRG
jgi:hypothetical protein